LKDDHCRESGGWQSADRKNKRRRMRSDLNQSDTRHAGDTPVTNQSIQPVTVQISQRGVNDQHSVSWAACETVEQNVQVANRSTASAAATEADDRRSINSYAVAAAKPANKEQQKRQQRQRKENLMIVGRSRKSFSQNKHAGHTDVIKAAKPYISKATFCVDNVSTHVTVESMIKFVNAMDIDVLGCYDVNPRRTNWERQRGITPVDRKTFRLCIPREDCERLLDPQRWPAHISVSQWRFKAKAQAQSGDNAITDVRSSSPATTLVRRYDNDTQLSVQLHHSDQHDTLNARSAVAPAFLDAAVTDVSVTAEGFISGTPQQSTRVGSDHTSTEDAGDLDLEETIIHHGECE